MEEQQRALYPPAEAANCGRDLLIPGRFVRVYLERLSPEALKTYLYLQCQAQQGDLDQLELLQRLSRRYGSGRMGQVMAELCREGLIVLKNDEALDLENLNLKDCEQFLASSLQAAEAERLGQVPPDERQTLTQSIADTFYQGSMARAFYALIDRCFEDYHFSPEVIYALFGEARDYGRLGDPYYVEAIARNWQLSGVQSFEQLNRYMDERLKRKSREQWILRQLGLQREVTEPERQLMQRWFRDWQVSEELLAEALQRSTAAQNPSIKYLHKVLEAWHKAGISTPEELARYEQEREGKRRFGLFDREAKRKVGQALPQESGRERDVAEARDLAQASFIERIRRRDGQK